MKTIGSKESPLEIPKEITKPQNLEELYEEELEIIEYFLDTSRDSYQIYYIKWDFLFDEQKVNLICMHNDFLGFLFILLKRFLEVFRSR
jgi:hypothetical protein